jgi:glycoside hydrolase, family 3 domain protein
MDREEKWRKQVKDWIKEMTLEEKTSQLTYQSPAIKRFGIPAYNWWNEALHGVARAGTATSFPQMIGMAASFDEELVKEVADAISTEGRAKYNESIKNGDRDIYKGLTFWCPNINIFRDPRWGRGHETFGEDPFLTSLMGKAYVHGIQGDSTHLKAAACAKHFAVHSGPEEGRHSFDSKVSEKDLWETYLPAFEACVKEARVEGVMGAYNRLNGEACCGSKTLLTEILREKWGFDGYVVSDCGAIADIHVHHGITNTAEESAALALESGCDLNCGSIYLYVYGAAKKGLIPEEAIDRAVGHLLMTRMRLGMFEPCEYDEIPYEEVESKKHLDLARKAGQRSMVLLKNDGILPLDKTKLKTVGVIGPNADSREALWGNYYGTSSVNMTILEGIQRELGEDVRVLYAKGSHLYRETDEAGAYPNDRAMEAVAVAKRSDVIILCLGLDASIEGEEGDASNEYAAGDRKTLSLPKSQQNLLKTVLAAGKPVVLCMMAGSGMNLELAEEKANAILQVWYPGATGGSAVSDILFGKVSPSAKLPITFYRSEKDLPAFEDYSMKGRTYRYLEKEPLYPFGYGLTYSDIYCKNAKYERSFGGEIKITAELVNDGIYESGEVLQVYVKNLDSPYAVRNWSLANAKPIYLKKKESSIFECVLKKEVFEVVNDQGERVRDGKRFRIYVGCSQPDKRSVVLTGHRPIELEVEYV